MIVVFAVSAIYIYDFFSYNTWVTVGDMQCGWNPWHAHLQGGSVPLETAVKDYYATQGVTVYGVKSIKYFAHCTACDCPVGEVRILVNKRQKNKMLGNGYKSISRLKVFTDSLW